MLHKFASFCLCAALSVSIVLCALTTPVFADPDFSNFNGLLGTILKGAIAQQQNRQMWNNLPIDEDKCLRAHNTSAAILANHGISLYDPRVQRLFAQCSQENAAPPVANVSEVPASTSAPVFAIDSLPVDGFVSPGSAAYRAYKCRPSEDYPGFQWCGRHRALTSASGPYDEWMTLFHSGSNQATLLLQDIIPAYFHPGDADREIDRLSRRFGQTPRIYRIDSRPEAPHAILAVWGDATLTPLDKDSLDALRRGDQIHVGLITDFLGDSRKSATLNMPVYRIGGGAGYIWGARYDDSGKGRLRIAAADASLLPSAKPATAPSIVTAHAPVQTPAPVPADADASTSNRTPLDAAGSPPVANPSPAAVKATGPEVTYAAPAADQPIVSSSANSGKRVALVIGNSAYNKFGVLPNPRKDAELVAETLRSKGFTSVVLLQDANRSEMASALNAFANEANQADWALVYYAGHGIEVGGINYMLPIDVQLKTDLDVQDEALSLERVLEAVKSAGKLSLVILDACRDNPFAREMRRSVAVRAVSRGLATPEPPSGIIVVYAAAAGQVANDGKGDHSPFTSALVKRINEPGLDVNLLGNRVAADVFNATGHLQRPFQYGSNLNSEALYFTPPAVNNSSAQQTAAFVPPPEIKALPAPQSNGVLDTYLKANRLIGEKNYVAALPLVEEAAKYGFTDAKVVLGVLYTSGFSGIPWKPEAAFQLFMAAANEGNASALGHVGYAYYKGEGTQQDIQRAISYINKAVSQNDPFAMDTMGHFWQDGVGGIPKDACKAVEYYKKADELNAAVGQVSLAAMYIGGLCVEKNNARAYELLNKAQNNGSPYAASLIAMMKEKGL